MEFEKYTERSRGIIQAAQSLALRSNHQRLAPEHILKILLDDKEGLAANLIQAASGDPAKARQSVAQELARIPSVEGDSSLGSAAMTVAAMTTAAITVPRIISNNQTDNPPRLRQPPVW